MEIVSHRPGNRFGAILTSGIAELIGLIFPAPFKLMVGNTPLPMRNPVSALGVDFNIEPVHVFEQEVFLRFADVTPAVDELAELVIRPFQSPRFMRGLQACPQVGDIVHREHAQVGPRPGKQVLVLAVEIKQRLPVDNQVAPFPAGLFTLFKACDDAFVRCLKCFVQRDINKDRLFGDTIRLEFFPDLLRNLLAEGVAIELQHTDMLIADRVAFDISSNKVGDFMWPVDAQPHLRGSRAEHAQHQRRGDKAIE